MTDAGKTETQKIADETVSKTKLDPQERLRRLREIQLPSERKIIKRPDFEIAWPEKVSVVGFVVITIICGLILFATWFMGKIMAGL
jgi:hypothetical protein